MNYFFIVILMLMTNTEGTIFNPIQRLIQIYKRTSLPLREDTYQNDKPIFSMYDFIIIGASPAGCVLANRLTENPETSVLLLEAGPEPSYITDIPGTHIMYSDTEYNWNYNSEYNYRVCKGMANEVCNWPSGRGIGGGTIWNGMIHTRGNRIDYDQWARDGNEGWSYDEVLKYFNKLENVQIDNFRGSPFRGSNGPVGVSYSPFFTNGVDTFIQAVQELGLPEIDYNVPYIEGVAKLQSTTVNGKRVNAATAYLEPIKYRKNLHIAQRAEVTEIVLDRNSKTAIGVKFKKKNIIRQIRARREVLLSAGAFGSPKLLMLSGIGPREHLLKVNVSFLHDLPVGHNLQEHVGTSLVLIANSGNFSGLQSGLGLDAFEKLLLYMNKNEGGLTSSGCEALVYWRSKYAERIQADVELFLLSLSYNDYVPFAQRYHSISDELYNAYWKPLEGKKTFSIYSLGSYPKSRGSISLRSNDPFDEPLIDNNFFYDSEDLDVIVESLKKIVEIANTSTMKSAGVKIYNKNLPGCEEYTFGSDEYFKCAAELVTVQYHHQCGTCKMGPESDPTSVVDSRLKVHGIKNLRVVDASIMPKIPAGHTAVPSYMIGEKASDMIKQDLGI